MAEIDLVFHGHFYQPPRENPWTDEVPREPSASPFHDWNQRIDAESYRPNAFARVVDEQGRIDDIVNNYELISFNFGPTLLRWLEREDPLTLARIVEADRRSARTRGGHGNAIAQAYNHMILPLANARDRATQMRWGIAEFVHRFGRHPEAMWLPETAANDLVLGELIDHGMRFAILAPLQAARVRRIDGDGSWQDVRGARVEPGRPYRWSHPDQSGRSLALFFYDGPLARSVAFGEALRDSHMFLEACTAAAHRGDGTHPIVHVAVDGETAGHHHAWGDRALAYALAREAAAKGFRVTNYAELLDRHPPLWEVELDHGELGEGTAWSCAHGVGRWIRDCGCRIGHREGWSQAWRGPLRAAFDLLRDRAIPFFEQEGGRLWRDPWAARDAYIQVLLRPSEQTREALLREHGRGLPGADAATRAFQLLEMQHQLLLMYTSCGWFFDDVGGLEAVQVMRYAARAMDLWRELGGDPPRAQFLELLAGAVSNDVRKGTAADLFRSRAEGARVTFGQMAAHLLMGTVRAPLPAGGTLGMCAYTSSRVRIQHDAARTLATGRLRLSNPRTGEVTALQGAMLHSGALEFRAWVRPEPSEGDNSDLAVHAAMPRGARESLEAALASAYGPPAFGVDALLDTGRQELLSTVFADVIGELGRTYSRLYHGNEGVIESLSRLGLALPPELRVVAELACTRAFEQAVAAATHSPDEERFAQALEIARLAGERGVAVDRQAAIGMLGRALEQLFAGWSATRTAEQPAAGELLARARAAQSVLELADELGLALDLYRAQELYWQALVAAGWTAPIDGEVRARVHEIGRRLGFSPALLSSADPVGAGDGSTSGALGSAVHARGEVTR